MRSREGRAASREGLILARRIWVQFWRAASRGCPHAYRAGPCLPDSVVNGSGTMKAANEYGVDDHDDG